MGKETKGDQTSTEKRRWPRKPAAKTALRKATAVEGGDKPRREGPWPLTKEGRGRTES